MALLHIDKVSCALASDKQCSAEVLRHLSLELHAGEFTVLIGRSGGGKTTLLRLLNRLETPTRGEIFFQGQPLAAYSPANLRRSIALVSQRPVMFPGTVLENTLLASHLGGAQNAEPSERARTCLEVCQVPVELHARTAKELSVGQQQRVALARALMMNPSVLLADEPTSALDRPTATLIMQVLRRFSRQKGCATLMVSHDLALVANYADRLVFLEGGQVVEQGGAGLILDNPQTAALAAFLNTVQPDDADA